MITNSADHYLFNDARFDEHDPGNAQALINLQGNILRGHSRDFGSYIFFRFRD
jgi:hypothetical protein